MNKCIRKGRKSEIKGWLEVTGDDELFQLPGRDSPD